MYGSQVEPQLRPSLAHAQHGEPGRPILTEKPEHRAPLAAHVRARALDRERDTPDRPTHAPIPPHPILPGLTEAFTKDGAGNRKQRIEIERHPMRIQIGARALLFMPAPEDVPQGAREILGRFARRRPSPRRPEVNLLIDALPLWPPIDKARPGRRTDKIVEPLVRP